MESISEYEYAKAQILEGIKEAVEELNLVLAGKIEARGADELLKELNDEVQNQSRNNLKTF